MVFATIRAVVFIDLILLEINNNPQSRYQINLELFYSNVILTALLFFRHYSSKLPRKIQYCIIRVLKTGIISRTELPQNSSLNLISLSLKLYLFPEIYFEMPYPPCTDVL